MWVRGSNYCVGERMHFLCGLEEALAVWVRGSTYCVGERKHLLCGLEGSTSCVG